MSRATVKQIRQTTLVAGVTAVLLFCMTAPPAPAVVPLIAASVGKEILKNLIFNEVKGKLIGSMAGMGCKGSTLVGMLAKVNISHGTPIPSGMTMGTGLSGLSATATPKPQGGITGFFNSMGDKVKSAFGGGHSNSATSSSQSPAEGEPVMGNGVRSFGGNPGTAEAPDMANAMPMAQREIAAGFGSAPPGVGPGASAVSQMDPQQMQQEMAMMGQMQDAMSTPLSRTETLVVFDELADLGVLTPDMHSDIRDCITLASPSAATSLGQTGAIFKSMVLPHLKAMKAQLAALPPENQRQLVDQMTQELKETDPSDRKAFLDGLGQGFFPQPVVDGVKAKLKAQ